MIQRLLLGFLGFVVGFDVVGFIDGFDVVCVAVVGVSVGLGAYTQLIPSAASVNDSLYPAACR